MRPRAAIDEDRSPHANRRPRPAETFAPLREVEPTPEDVARVLAMPTGCAPRALSRRRAAARRAVALVAATAAVIGAIAALPGGEDTRRPQDAHGVFQAAAAVAAERPRRLAYATRARRSLHLG